MPATIKTKLAGVIKQIEFKSAMAGKRPNICVCRGESNPLANKTSPNLEPSIFYEASLKEGRKGRKIRAIHFTVHGSMQQMAT